MTAQTHIAVYGTLRQNCGNWRWLLNREPVSPPIRITNFRMFSLGGFPAITPSSDSNDEVTVEVYSIQEEEISAFDGLEGYHGKGYDNNMYNRITIPIPELGLESVYIYVWGRSSPSVDERLGLRLMSGDWLATQGSF